MDSDKFEKLIKEAAPFLPEPKETTIFSIGGRGYFENPTTDLLAFFFDPNQVHGFQDLLLRSFFTCMGVAESLELSEPPRREETTGNGKRIDLVLISEDWVLGIENKIKQGQQNPFEDYNEHLETQFPNKKIYRAILSPAGTRVHPSWTAVPYKDFVSEIFAQLGFYFRQSPLTKWSIFLREFLVHLENIATEKSMEEEQIAFVEKNYTTISALLELCNEYHNNIQKQGEEVLKELFPQADISIKVNTWPLGPAIRFYVLDRWRNGSHMVIYITKDMGMRIIMYVNDIPQNEPIPTFDSSINIESWKTNNYWAWHTKELWSDHKLMFRNFRELAICFDKFLQTRQI